MQPPAMLRTSSPTTKSEAAAPYFGGNIRHNQENIFPWETEALEVMKIYKPKCIVLDLDFTLWPTFFSAHTRPPYIPLTGRPSQVLCVDKKTNKPRMLCLYPEVQRTIQFCLENDIMVSIASKNSNREDAQAILRSLGLWNRLHFPQIFHNRKTYHFRNLKSVTHFDYDDFLFFDDDVRNIAVCKNIGVNSFKVDRSTGFNGKLLLRALKECAEKIKFEGFDSCGHHGFRGLVDSCGGNRSSSILDCGVVGVGAYCHDARGEKEEEAMVLPNEIPRLENTVTSTASTLSEESCVDIDDMNLFNNE